MGRAGHVDIMNVSNEVLTPTEYGSMSHGATDTGSESRNVSGSIANDGKDFEEQTLLVRRDDRLPSNVCTIEQVRLLPKEFLTEGCQRYIMNHTAESNQPAGRCAVAFPSW